MMIHKVYNLQQNEIQTLPFAILILNILIDYGIILEIMTVLDS